MQATNFCRVALFQSVTPKRRFPLLSGLPRGFLVMEARSLIRRCAKAVTRDICERARSSAPTKAARLATRREMKEFILHDSRGERFEESNGACRWPPDARRRVWNAGKSQRRTSEKQEGHPHHGSHSASPRFQSVRCDGHRVETRNIWHQPRQQYLDRRLPLFSLSVLSLACAVFMEAEAAERFKRDVLPPGRKSGWRQRCQIRRQGRGRI